MQAALVVANDTGTGFLSVHRIYPVNITPPLLLTHSLFY
jgi:hypothetical protein